MKNIFTFALIVLLLAINPLVYAETKTISEQQAVNIATQAHPGRVLGVKRKAKTYQVKTLNDNGKLHVITIDANTGKIKSGKKSSK